jgi:hypothetical protein
VELERSRNLILALAEQPCLDTRRWMSCSPVLYPGEGCVGTSLHWLAGADLQVAAISEACCQFVLDLKGGAEGDGMSLRALRPLSAY